MIVASKDKWETKAMWLLKRCPRCKGDISFEQDQWGWYQQCLQCGYLRDFQELVGVKQEWTVERTFHGRVKAAPITNLTRADKPGNGSSQANSA